MIPAWLGVMMTILGIALGIFASHATLGSKVTRALTLLEDLARRMTVAEADIKSAAMMHYHRRSTDVDS